MGTDITGKRADFKEVLGGELGDLLSDPVAKTHAPKAGDPSSILTKELDSMCYSGDLDTASRPSTVK